MKNIKTIICTAIMFAFTHINFTASKIIGTGLGIGCAINANSQNVGAYNDYSTHKYIWFRTNSPDNYPDPCELVMEMNSDTMWFHQNYFFFDTIVKHETSVSGSSSMLSLNTNGELAITSFSDILVPYSQITGGPSGGTTLNGTGFVKATGTVITYDNSSYYLNSNPSGYINSVPAQSFSSLTGKPTTLTGYGITDAYPLSGNPSSFVNQAGARTAISGGTGISYNSSTGVISNTASSGVTSVGLTSTDFVVSGSPVTSSGNITANLNTTGVSAGNYDWVTVDTKGRVTSGGNMSIPSTIAAGTRSFNTAYQVSNTVYSKVFLGVSISCNLSLSGGQAGTVLLEISPNGSTGWISITPVSNSNLGTLTIGLNTTQAGGYQLSADLPPGYYYRLTTTNNTGTPTFSFTGGSYITY